MRAGANWLCGDLLAAEEDALSALESAQPPSTAWTLATTWGIHSLIDQGHIDEAIRLIPPPNLEGVNRTNRPFIEHAAGCALAAAGEHKAALSRFEVAQAETDGQPPPGCLPIFEDMSRSLAALGQRKAALAHSQRATELANTYGSGFGIAMADLAAAELADAPNQALKHLASAIDLLEPFPMPLVRARALIAQGAALRRAGARQRARAVLRDGLELARQRHAQPLVDLASRELAVAGARPRKLAFSGVESLTAAERRVASLATEGMTNRQIAQSLFVTTKTVETHLSNTYRKLDVNSRSDLRSLMAVALPFRRTWR
ncbi:hypothetical protein AYO39_02395 [Actinobacteria bacterium SCGC AG-212-D09]|nr:hypothetical protein AYO39_02395 [Actinobacteria bacterium SCGC AG-212-D09]